MTFYEVLDEYINYLQIYGKGRSVDQARFHGKLLADHFQMQEASEIGDKEINAYVRDRLEYGWSPPTVNASLRVFKAAMRYCGVNAKPRMLKVIKRLPTTLTAVEVDQLVESAKENEPTMIAHDAIVIAAYAGLRHKEIVHLAKSDVDIMKATLSVTAKPEVNWTPKNHQERVIPFKKGGRLEEVLVRRTIVPDTRWLFHGASKKKPRKDVQAEVRYAFLRAHLYCREDKSGLHMLRRSWASRLIERGADINTVRELGGWSNLEVLLHYLRASDESKRLAIERIE